MPPDHTIVLALITAAPAIIAALLAGVAVILGIVNKRSIEDGRKSIHDVHDALNGRMQELIVASGKAGELKEKEAQAAKEGR